MASDKKTKTDPAPKSDTAAKDKSTPEAGSAKTEAKTETKTEASETPAGAAPKNYSRGEGQKPVTQAYKDNWNLIFGKKAKKKR